MKHIVWIAILLAPSILGCGASSTGSNSNGASSMVGGLGQARNYPNPSDFIYLGDTAIGDINGDGRNDVAAIQLGNNTGLVLIYYQNSTGELDKPIVLDTSIYTYGIAIADINNDGKDDLILSGLAKSVLVGSLGRVLTYVQAPVSGNLQSPREYEIKTNSPVWNLIVADMNGDGRNDVCVLASQVGLDSYVAVLYQDTQGELNPEIAVGTGAVRFGGIFRIGDVNNDNMSDIVAASGQLVVIRQLAPGRFSLTPDIYPEPINAVAIGDLNGDGRKDVLATGPGDTSLKIFRQKDDGTLNIPYQLDIPIYNPALGMNIADITRDGLNDILLDVIDDSPDGDGWGGVAVYPQEIDHTFRRRLFYSYHSPSFGGGFYHNGLSVGDITGDTYPDVVVTWSDYGLFVFPHVTE